MKLNIGTILTFKTGEFEGKTVRVISSDFRGIITTDINGSYSETVGYFISRENIRAIFNITE